MMNIASDAPTALGQPLPQQGLPNDQAPVNVPMPFPSGGPAAPQHQSSLLDSLEGLLQGQAGSPGSKSGGGGFGDISSILSGGGQQGGDGDSDSGIMQYAKYIPAALQFASMFA